MFSEFICYFSCVISLNPIYIYVGDYCSFVFLFFQYFIYNSPNFLGVFHVFFQFICVVQYLHVAFSFIVEVPVSFVR